MCKSIGVNEVLPSSCLSRNKAVADGALSFYLDHSVRSRVSRFTYGIQCRVLYDINDAEHLQRSASSVISLGGDRRIPGGFDVILPKVGHLSLLCLTWILLIQYVQNTQTSETKEFRRAYFQEVVSLSGLSGATVGIDCYRGKLANPRWIDIDAGTSLFPLLTVF